MRIRDSLLLHSLPPALTCTYDDPRPQNRNIRNKLEDVHFFCHPASNSIRERARARVLK